jgi:hypothetical protein
MDDVITRMHDYHKEQRPAFAKVIEQIELKAWLALLDTVRTERFNEIIDLQGQIPRTANYTNCP